MALSNEFLNYMSELEKIKNWEKLPKTDPRIVKLQELANNCEKHGPIAGKHKKVVVMHEGKFVNAYNSAVEAAEGIGITAEAVRKIARGERRPPEGLKIEYIEKEVY